jgi:hypothetical protein
MAARLGYGKVKEYRTQIVSVKQWLKEIDFDGLLSKLPTMLTDRYQHNYLH